MEKLSAVSETSPTADHHQPPSPVEELASLRTLVTDLRNQHRDTEKHCAAKTGILEEKCRDYEDFITQIADRADADLLTFIRTTATKITNKYNTYPYAKQAPMPVPAAEVGS